MLQMLNVSYAPILLFELLVQLELVVDGAHSSHELLVLPGVRCCDAVAPHREQRDGTCGDEETEPQIKTHISRAMSSVCICTQATSPIICTAFHKQYYVFEYIVRVHSSLVFLYIIKKMSMYFFIVFYNIIVIFWLIFLQCIFFNYLYVGTI